MCKLSVCLIEWKWYRRQRNISNYQHQTLEVRFQHLDLFSGLNEHTKHYNGQGYGSVQRWKRYENISDRRRTRLHILYIESRIGTLPRLQYCRGDFWPLNYGCWIMKWINYKIFKEIFLFTNFNNISTAIEIADVHPEQIRTFNLLKKSEKWLYFFKKKSDIVTSREDVNVFKTWILSFDRLTNIFECSPHDILDS